jgi:hypothetical protein
VNGSFDVTVEDTTPPTFISLTANPNVLGDPNHKMVPIDIAAVVSDLVDPSPVTKIISVSSNEPDDGPGDGNRSPDWQITGDLTLLAPCGALRTRNRANLHDHGREPRLVW